MIRLILGLPLVFSQVLPQCEKCETANILFFGGRASNGHVYGAEGYEFFRNFMVSDEASPNSFELGNFTDYLVTISDAYDAQSNSIAAQPRSIIVETFRRV
jgi:hypothetical protein